MMAAGLRRGEWTSVTATFLAGPLNDAVVDQLLKRDDITMLDYRPGASTYTVTFFIETALEKMMSGALKRLVSFPGDPVRVEATDGAELECQLTQPGEAYGGVAEVAELLGVAKQRIGQLIRDNDLAPQPVAALRSGPVWKLADWTLFQRNWVRKNGRPSKEMQETSDKIGRVQAIHLERMQAYATEDYERARRLNAEEQRLRREIDLVLPPATTPLR